MGKAAATVKPDSEKSTLEKVGDTMKGKLDSISSKVQPESQKSTGQKVGDTISSGHGESGTSLVNKAKDAAEDIENRVTD